MKDFTEKDIAKFKTDILDVCIKHGLCIAHEDTQGAFQLEEYNTETMLWLLDCDEYVYEKRGDD
jgi:hypothetical protein